MNFKGAVGLAIMMALGLVVALSIMSLNPRGIDANEVPAQTGDAFVCGSVDQVNDPSVDIDSVIVREVSGGWLVVVSVVPSFASVFADSYSAAVHVEFGSQFGFYDIFAGVLLHGLVDIDNQIIPGTEDNVTIGPEGDVTFFFPGPLAPGTELTVLTFHQQMDGDPLNCDIVFPDDPITSKLLPNEPTSTAASTDLPPTATSPSTATPAPALFDVHLQKLDEDEAIVADGLTGWEMKIYDGAGCAGSPISSGLTVLKRPIGVTRYSTQLPPGDYSVAETQQPGWQRVFPEAFCQNFIVSDAPVHINFRNGRIRNGDVNEDGVTNSLDVLLVLQRIAGLIPDQPGYVRADVNEDGVINAVDVALMLQFDAGLLDRLPVGGG